MIKGIEVFQKHFAGLAGGYVVIGGAACDLLFAQSALPFRATRDLDIVLCMEGEGGGFARKFWEFVKTGGYQAPTAPGGCIVFAPRPRPATPPCWNCSRPARALERPPASWHPPRETRG